MSLEDIAEVKPHLREVIDLYGRVKLFAELELANDYSRMAGQHSHYVGADIERAIEGFSSIFDIPVGELDALKEALGSGRVNFLGLPGAEADGPGPSPAGEAPSVLYILSRPFFRAISFGTDADGIRWEGGRCPVCNAVPVLSVLDKDSPRRYQCSWCGTTGYYNRIGCPYCRSETAGDMEILSFEGYEDVRIDVCNKCKTYYKSVKAELLAEHDLAEHDLISLPLDIVAQGKGFVRRSPNPVGLTRFE